MGEPFPVVKQGDVQAAEGDRIHGALAALGVGTAATVGYSLANAPGGFFPRKFFGGFLGVETRPQPGRSFGPGVSTFPRLGIPFLFLPQPVGFVPAEAYGLQPNVIQESLGFRMGKRPPWINPDESRVRIFAAQQVADDIGSRALGVPNDSGARRRVGYVIPPGHINIFPAEVEYLKTLPPGVSDAQLLLPQLEARVNDLIGGRNRLPTVPTYPNQDMTVLAAIEKSFPLGHELHLRTPIDGATEAVEIAGGKFIPIGAGGLAVGPARRL